MQNSTFWNLWSLYKSKTSGTAPLIALFAASTLAGCRPYLNNQEAYKDALQAQNNEVSSQALQSLNSSSFADFDQNATTTLTIKPSQGNLGIEQLVLNFGEDYKAENICSSKKIYGRAGSAACIKGSTSAEASAAQVLSGKELWDSSGTKITGTLSNRGSWDLSSSFPGSGYYSGVTNTPGASTICSSTTILGVAGSATCGASSSSTTTSALSITDINHASNTSRTVTASAGTAYSSVTVDLGADFLASNICSGKTVLGRAGSGTCITTSSGNQGAASDLLSGKEFWDSSGTKVTGTMSNRGSWTMSSSFPGAGYYSGVSGAPAASVVCSGTTVAGTAGSATCQGTSGGTNAGASDVLAGTYFWNSSGTSTVGTMTDRGSTWDLTTAFPGTGKYSGVTSAITAAQVCSGRNFLGSAASAVCQSGTTSAAASASQILSGKEAWDSTGAKITGTATASAGNICSGNTILGVAGTATCQGGSGSGSAASSTQICQNTYLWNNSGTVVSGTKPCGISTTGFTPTSITGLKVWLMADDLKSTDGNSLFSWRDLSGNGNDAIQATSSKQPTYKTSILNSKPIVRFSGAQTLALPSIAFDSAISIIAVSKPDSTAATRDLIASSSESPRQTFSNTGAFTAYHNGNVGYNTWTTTTTYQSTWLLTSIIHDRSQIQTDEVKIYVNGAAPAMSQSDANNNTNTFGSIALNIGSWDGTQFYFKGDIAEILIFNANLSNTDRQSIETYLNEKYAIY